MMMHYLIRLQFHLQDHKLHPYATIGATIYFGDSSRGNHCSHAIYRLATSSRILLARTLTPVSQFLYGSQIQIYPDTTVHTFEEVIDEYSRLRTKVTELEAAVGRKELIEEENNLLRSQLGFVNSYGYYVLSADVIGRQIDPTESTIILNRGTQSGITKEMPVIVGDGILIGKITIVEETRSIVRLLNDSQSNVAATINNEEKVLVL